MAIMSISGLYDVASAELGGVSLLTAVVDRPDTVINKRRLRTLQLWLKSSRFFENTNWQYAVAYNIDTI